MLSWLTSGNNRKNDSDDIELKVLKFLNENGDGDVSEEEISQFLHWICSNKQIALLKQYLEKISTLDVTNIQYLLNLTDKEGQTPLHISCREEFHDGVRLLIDHDVSLIEKDCYGNTPLHWACVNGNLTLVNLLLEKLSPTNSNLENNEGRTPLHTACREGYDTIVEVLLQKGIDISIRDRYGKTPLDWAKERNHMKCINRLENTFKVVAVQIHNLEDDKDKDDKGDKDDAEEERVKEKQEELLQKIRLLEEEIRKRDVTIVDYQNKMKEQNKEVQELKRQQQQQQQQQLNHLEEEKKVQEVSTNNNNSERERKELENTIESLSLRVKDLKEIVSECAVDAGIDEELFENLQLLRRSVKAQRYLQLNEKIKKGSTDRSLLKRIGVELKELKYLSSLIENNNNNNNNNNNDDSRSLMTHGEILLKSHTLIEKLREKEKDYLLLHEEETAKAYEEEINKFILLLNKININIGVRYDEWEKVNQEKKELIEKITQLQGTLNSEDLEASLSDAVMVLSNQNEMSINQIKECMRNIQEKIETIQK